jgi:hypothetical protein
MAARVVEEAGRVARRATTAGLGCAAHPDGLAVYHAAVGHSEIIGAKEGARFAGYPFPPRVNSSSQRITMNHKNIMKTRNAPGISQEYPPSIKNGRINIAWRTTEGFLPTEEELLCHLPETIPSQLERPPPIKLKECL